MYDDIPVRRGAASNVPPIIREALAYWEGKLAGRSMPARRDFDPVFEIPHLLPRIMLVDVLRDPLDFRYRVIGMGIAERSTRNYTGRRLSELSHVTRTSPLWTDRQTVIETRAPKLTAPAYTGGSKTVQSVSGIHLPLSSDGETVDMIFTFVAYRTT